MEVDIQVMEDGGSNGHGAVNEALLEVMPTISVGILADLFSLGVCARCVFRFLNIRKAVYSIHLPSSSVLLSLAKKVEGNGETIKPVKSGSGETQQRDRNIPRITKPCSICLGMLQMSDPTEWTGAPKDIAEHIGKTKILEATKPGGHQFDSFCLEVSVPAVTLVRERALWWHLQKAYNSRGLFEGWDPSDHIVSLKEAIKWCLIESLQETLNVNFDSASTFRIALVYKYADSAAELEFLSGNDTKRRRKGYAATPETSQEGFAAVAAARSAESSESMASVQRSLASMADEVFARHFPCPPVPPKEACELTVMCWRSSVYVGGRYLKFSRNISQSRWMIEEERMGDGSVQEIVGDLVCPFFKADTYKFHAAGREDIDVRMLGNGRPFLLEIQNARVIPCKSEMAKLENLVNSTQSMVQVRGLQEVGTHACSLMRQGEAEKQKEYAAVVWLSRPVVPSDFEKLSCLKELTIEQNTPIRVLHRRSPLVRPRIIHWMRCEEIPGSDQYFLLYLCTQAGTYVKEFVHGDLGRTVPNIGSLLDCEAQILQLDVVDVVMDFLLVEPPSQ